MATTRQAVAQVRRLVAWGRQTRPARAAARFSAAGGGVLTGGIAYATLFSLFAGLTLGFTVLVGVLGSDEALRDEVVSTVSDVLPGLVDTGDGSGGAVPLAALQLSPAFTVAGIVAVVALVMSALSAVAAFQTGLRAMFDLQVTENVAVAKLRQLGGLVGAGAAVLVSAVLSAAAGWLVGARGWVGLVTGVVVAFVVDTLTFVFAVRLLAGARPPRRDLLWGALIAGVALGAVRLLGTSLVSGAATANPLLASFAAVVVLLAWVNLVARLLLLAAAWTADPPAADEPPDGRPD